ncbi:MAG TPA: asparagine synthase-related protein [Sphingopyxis sp.]|nr:asparagine synthase-related protein [Sphingopyxis sp.]HMQ17886.1 asparagine synthase-related protein [Sphingopyxis sp.]
MHRLCGIIDERADPAATTAIAAALGGGEVAQADGAIFGAAATARRAAARDALHIADGLLVAADARIDGQAELRAALGDVAPPPGASAAALIAAAWRRWGRDCPLHLYGDYAFALHDARSGESFAARDHVGARPFFYSETGGRLAFASDSATLLALPGISDALDEDYVATALLSRDFQPLGRSFFGAVRRLEPGHRLHMAGDDIRVDRWWQPEAIAVDETADDAETVARYRRLVEQAITDRLAGAERFAVHLSGGLDSSLIAALAVPELRARGLADPPGYSWHLVDPDADPGSEPGWSEAIRARLDLQLFAPELSIDELTALFLQDWTRGPDIRNLLHEAAIQRDASGKGVEVILSGWGGDEGASFNGRGHHPWLLLTGRWRTLYRDRHAPGMIAGLRTIYHAARRVGREYRPRVPLRLRHAAGQTLVAPGLLRRARLLPVPRLREFGARRTMHSLLRYSSTTARMEDWAISGAARGLDYRFPLLDRRLLEFLYTLPPRMFRRGGTRRWLIREASKGLLPEVIRRNNSKSEPLRVGWIEKAIAETMIRLADRIDASASLPSRARYVDMERLQHRLAEVRRTGMVRDSALRIALQFLDIP